jgi:AcrR family transcriptional regulator
MFVSAARRRNCAPIPTSFTAPIWPRDERSNARTIAEGARIAFDEVCNGRQTNIPLARFPWQRRPMLKRRLRETKDPATRATRPKTRRKRNLPAEERRRELLDAALDIFSEKGMGITIQALADRVNVTQPLVHRYFRTRADLIAGIREKIQFAHWDPVWREVLTDRSRPLQDRILEFYDRYLPHIYSARWYRGFWYSALSDPTFAQEFLARVHEELLLSIVGEARFKFGFPDLQCTPAAPREIELVWGMHSTNIFLGIRRYVYHTPVSPDLAATVFDQMRAYLLVVPEVMAELMPATRTRTSIGR